MEGEKRGREGSDASWTTRGHSTAVSQYKTGRSISVVGWGSGAWSEWTLADNLEMEQLQNRIIMINLMAAIALRPCYVCKYSHTQHTVVKGGGHGKGYCLEMFSCSQKGETSMQYCKTANNSRMVLLHLAHFHR